MKNPVTPAGIEPATFRFVAQHLNHCVLPLVGLCHTIVLQCKVQKKIRFYEIRNIFWLDDEVLQAKVESCCTELEASLFYGKYL